MHPYQQQIDRMWMFIKLKGAAQKNGHLIEAMCFGYTLLEIELRLLLTSKAGKDSKPLSVEQINNAGTLIKLAKLAENNDFIDEGLFNEIKSYNRFRIKYIHYLAQGDILYSELDGNVEDITHLIEKIQSKWLPITYGDVEEIK